MRKSKKFSGLPSEHARLTARNGAAAGNLFRDARHALKDHDCQVAYDYLLQGVEHLAMAEVHNSGAEGNARIPAHIHSMARDITSDFATSCLRKPGLLDRLRRKRR